MNETVYVEAPHKWRSLPQRKPPPQGLLRNVLLRRRKGPPSGLALCSGPSEDTGKRLTLGACFPHRNTVASDPSAVREELEKGQVDISLFLPRPPWSSPSTVGKIWRAYRGCCRNTRSWSRKWVSSRPRWRCVSGCGVGPGPGYRLWGTLCRQAEHMEASGP